MLRRFLTKSKNESISIHMPLIPVCYIASPYKTHKFPPVSIRGQGLPIGVL
jgi:hypothetical protein